MPDPIKTDCVLFVKGRGKMTRALERPPRPFDECGQEPGDFLDRHIQGDWGQVCQEDKALNDAALVHGGRLLSAYATLKGTTIWIITEATSEDQGHRAATTLLLPDEY